MKVFLKRILSSCLFLLAHFYSLGCVYSPYENEFRITSFDANFINFRELNAFCFNSDYLNEDISEEKYNWSQNIDQWYNYCQSPTVKKEDIYHALYGGKPVDVKYNTFINYIQKNKKEAYRYLQELLNPSGKNFTPDKRTVFKERWDAFATQKHYYYSDSYAFDAASIEFTVPHVLNNITNCKDSFVAKRWAYQGVVYAYYQGHHKVVKDLFEKYFTRKNRTWIDNSAQHYYALVSENSKALMLECIIHGYDKMTRNLELLKYAEGFNENFAMSLDDTTRSYYYFVKGVREYGRGLSHLKNIYRLNPKNKYFDFLINREVNKIENWLLSPSVISEKGYFSDQQERESVRNNYYNDVLYTKEFLEFMKSINKKTLFHEIAIAYTEYLLGIKNSQFNPEKYRNKNSQYVQAKIVDFLINFDKKSASGEYKKDLIYIFNHVDSIDREKPVFGRDGYGDYNDYQESIKYMRQQLARNLGIFIMKRKKHKAEGFLLTGKSMLPQNQWSPFFGQSIYVNIYDKAYIDDCIEILKILSIKRPDEYIRFLQKDEMHHEKIHYCNDFKGSQEGTYDTIKIQDILGQKYVSEEKFEKALEVYKRFPSQYWENACEEMPFVVNINQSRTPFGYKDMTYFNKLTFLEQLVDYLKILKKNPNDALINYYVANAYYSVSLSGCFWYIACPYNNSENFNEARESFFFDKATYHFEKVLKNSNNESIVSASIICLNWMGKLNQKALNNKTYKIYQDMRGNCDLYAQYLHNLSNSYRSTVNVKSIKSPLVKFRDFDRKNVY
jgi:hypothetical protein